MKTKEELNKELIKNNEEFIKSIIDDYYNEPKTLRPITYSDIKIRNQYNVDVLVPTKYVDYWNLIITDRPGVIKRLKSYKTQHLFDIVLKDYYTAYNKLSDEEKKLYI